MDAFLFPQKLQPAAVRQVDIQNQQAEDLLRQLPSGLLQCMTENNSRLRGLQRHPDSRPKRSVILQQQDFFHCYLHTEALR